MNHVSGGNTESAWRILELPEGSDDRAIRKAYLRKVRESPPDRSPEQFEEIRDAYQTLRDPRSRAMAFLESVDPNATMVALVDGHVQERRFAGLEPWMSAAKRR